MAETKIKFYVRYHKIRDVWRFLQNKSLRLYPMFHVEDRENVHKFMPDLREDKTAVYAPPQFLGYLEDGNNEEKKAE